MGLLTQITTYLEQILNGIAGNLWLSLLFIFLVCIGEAVFIVGLLVPSLPILLLTGGLIAAGKLPFWPIYLAAVLGAVIGDAISYWIGHAFKHRIKTLWPFRNYVHLIEQGEEFFQKHGGAAIFIGRFITGVFSDIIGWRGAFMVLAAMTLAGAIAVALLLPREKKFVRSEGLGAALKQMLRHFRNRQLLATYAVGFGVLFNFIATFTFVSFRLAAAPYNLSAPALGARVNPALRRALPGRAGARRDQARPRRPRRARGP